MPQLFVGQTTHQLYSKLRPSLLRSTLSVAVQFGLVPVLERTLRTVGLLDPVSARTGIRVSEEVLIILAVLKAITPQTPEVSSSCSQPQLLMIKKLSTCSKALLSVMSSSDARSHCHKYSSLNVGLSPTTSVPLCQGNKDADEICRWAVDMMQKWTPIRFGRLLHPPAPLRPSAGLPTPPVHPPYRRVGIVMFFNCIRCGHGAHGHRIGARWSVRRAIFPSMGLSVVCPLCGVAHACLGCGMLCCGTQSAMPATTALAKQMGRSMTRPLGMQQ